MCRVGNLGLLLLSWSLICWVAMSESSDLDLSQSPCVAGVVFCNIKSLYNSVIFCKTNSQDHLLGVEVGLHYGDLECKVKITSDFKITFHDKLQ